MSFFIVVVGERRGKGGGVKERRAGMDEKKKGFICWGVVGNFSG
jgi:hypothetical protein